MAKKKAEENKPTTREVVIVNGDDWKGVYIDGKLRYEGHNIRPEELLKLLGINCRDFECDLNWLEDLGNLPEDLKDVKLPK
jgi:hypothetical protein